MCNESWILVSNQCCCFSFHSPKMQKRYVRHAIANIWSTRIYHLIVASIESMQIHFDLKNYWYTFLMVEYSLFHLLKTKFYEFPFLDIVYMKCLGVTKEHITLDRFIEVNGTNGSLWTIMRAKLWTIPMSSSNLIELCLGIVIVFIKEVLVLIWPCT